MKIINEMFAFISSDNECEGVMAFQRETDWMPMVGADMARIEQLRPIAQELANEFGISIKLVRFNVRKEIETISPRKAH